MNENTSSSHTLPGVAIDRRSVALGTAAVLSLAAMALLQPNFMSVGNLRNIAVQSSYLAIFALAQTFVITVRGFDLSLGTAVSLISVASAMALAALTAAGLPIWVAVAASCVSGLAIGAAVGALNGLAVSYLSLNPFIATLAMLNVCLGLASTISGGFQIFDLPAVLHDTFYAGTFLGIPAPIVIAGALLLAAHFTFSNTRLGRSLILVGSNPRAAFVAGINVKSHVAIAYILCGIITAVGAFMLTARTGSGEPNLGGALMLESIAATVIGGASLRGGRASALNPLLGAALTTVLSNGMNLCRVDGYLQQVILGVVIIFAVCVSRKSE
jgi:ribose transport system permease protein